MKKRFLKQTMAVALSTAMALAPMTALADDSATGTGAIFSYKVQDVVVPTTYTFAMNPDGLPIVQAGVTGTVTSQIVSQSMGIVNRSSYDQIVKVELEVTDLNAAIDDTPSITFVSEEADITKAARGEYKVLLQLVPANSATAVEKFYDSANSYAEANIDTDTAAAALGNVVMAGNTSAAVTLASGSNDVLVKLTKGTYDLKDSTTIALGTDTANDVASKFELKANGGVTAFKFDGKMNSDADWTKLTAGVKVDAIYEFTTVTGKEKAVTGTAMVTIPTTVDLNGKVITITGLKGTNNYQDGTVTITKLDGTEMTVVLSKVPNYYTRDDSAWTEAGGGNIVFTFVDALDNVGVISSVSITLADDTVIVPVIPPVATLEGKVLTIANLSSESNYVGGTLTIKKKADGELAAYAFSAATAYYTRDDSAWTEADGGTIVITFKDNLDTVGTIENIKITLSDGTEIEP